MKISKQQLKQIIKEEMDKVLESEEFEFGKQKTTRSAASTGYKQKAKDMQSQTGVDDVERGIINQIEKLLTDLADKTNIKGGTVNSTLKKLYKVLQKELGEETDEQ